MNELKKMISCKELLLNSWHDYAENFKKFMVLYLKNLYYVFLSILPLAIFGLLLVLLVNISGLQKDILIATSVLSAIFSIVMIIYYSTRLKIAMILLARGSQANAKEIFINSKKYFWPFLWTSLLVSLVIIGGAFALIIPALIFGVYVSFATYIILEEGKNPSQSLKESYSLVKGYWWATTGRFLLLFLFLTILSLPAVIFAEGSSAATIYNFIYNLISFLIAPYLVIYSYKIYENLKELKK